MAIRSTSSLLLLLHLELTIVDGISNRLFLIDERYVVLRHKRRQDLSRNAEKFGEENAVCAVAWPTLI